MTSKTRMFADSISNYLVDENKMILLTHLGNFRCRM